MEYTIKQNAEFNSLEIYFDGKPSEQVRSALKALKYRWHGLKRCWYGRTDEETVKNAIDGAGAMQAETDAAAIVAKNNALGKCYCDTVDAYLDPEGGYKGSNSHVYGHDVPDAARKILKECGIKGVTVSKKCASMCTEIIVKVRLMEGDVKQFEECRETLEKQVVKDMHYYGWITDPDNPNCAEIPASRYYDEFDGEKQRRWAEMSARKFYDQCVNGYPYSICHGWQADAEKFPMFTEKFWDRWQAVTKIISSFNWDRSNSQVDYFDVNFYEDWNILPMKAA